MDKETVKKNDELVKFAGVKFYRFDHKSELEIVRIKSVDEVKNTYKMVVIKGDNVGSKITITADELNKNWTRLIPDGILFINHVIHDEDDDVIVTLHGKKGKVFDPKPFAVCRQQIVDIFSYAIRNPNETYIMVGMSINRITCPAGIPFDELYKYKGELKSVATIAIYVDDTLNDILSIINTKKYDDALRRLKSMDKTIQGKRTMGWSLKLKQLLSQNNFMFDFHSLFGIIEVPFSLKDPRALPTKALMDIIVEETGNVPSAVYVYPYDKTVDLNKLERAYILATSDSRSKENDKSIYIVGYDIDEKQTIADYKYGGIDNARDKLKAMGFDIM